MNNCSLRFKSLFLFVLLLITSMVTKANPVDLNKARQVGTKFLKANTSIRISDNTTLKHSATYRTSRNVAAFYIFNADEGFVIVSADDCARPILGYSVEGAFDEKNVPVQMEDYLQDFVKQIEYGIEQHLEADKLIARQWELVSFNGRLNYQRATNAVEPLVKARWGQGCYYNNLCPEDPDGNCGHVLVGCVAIAMGQIMHYWGYPETGSGSYSYTPIDQNTWNYSDYPVQTANFGDTNYDWSNMTNSLTASSTSAQVEAVSTLLWHCGVSVSMMYGTSGSGAYSEDVPYAMQNYFLYSNDMQAAYRSNYTDTQWLNLIKASLNSNKPVYYSGSDTQGQGGHAFVCDGYDSNNYLHFNWGWYGNQDNYFALGALNVSSYQFNNSNYAIVNIHPECIAGTNYQVTASVSPAEGGSISGTGIYECGSQCTLNATPANGYTFCSWTEDGLLLSTDPTISFTVYDNRNLVANFTSGNEETCGLVFTFHDSYGDGWNGNTLLVNYSSGCFNEEDLTLESGSSGTFYRNVPKGSHIVLNWVIGGWPEECSFTISYDNGYEIYNVTDLSDGFSSEFDVACGNTYSITAVANPTAGGSVTGGRVYMEGETCTLSAYPYIFYSFENWTKNGMVVSSNPTFSFTVSEDADYVANFVFNSDGIGVLGYSTYDWQSNCGARTWTHVWPDGKVSFAFTQATDETFGDRGTGIGTYDYETDEWIPSAGRIENIKTGFGSIAQYGNNGIVIASHTPNDCRIFIAPNKDDLKLGSVSTTSVLDPTYDPSWPNVMTSGPNRDIIHVIATGYSDNTMYYFRSTNGGQSWDKENVILPYMTSDYCSYWNSNCCYWMETTDDNCLALVVNNAWSDGMVLYSYDDGETWERKVFYKHPDPFGSFDDWFMFPRWTSCQWGANGELCVLYEYNGSTGEYGSGSFYPSIGGVAFWSENMPYNEEGTTESDIPGNLTPGQPFVLESNYIINDLHNSYWQWADASHIMWPEYIGYLPALDDNGQWENPYEATEFNIEDKSLHGNYNSGVCANPVLCKVPGSYEFVAVWSAMDENHQDEYGNYYYKLFASYSPDGGQTWTDMVHLTSDAQFNYNEFVYNQAAVVGRKLIVVSQMDGTTGTYVQSDDSDAYDNLFVGLTFDIDDLFESSSTQYYSITATANPTEYGVTRGSGRYAEGSTCTLKAFANAGYLFTNWTKDGVVVSTEATYSFTVEGDDAYVANFMVDPVTFQVTASANPSDGGYVNGAGTYTRNTNCTLTAIPNQRFAFINWTDASGQILSYSSSFTFPVTQDITLFANFYEYAIGDVEGVIMTTHYDLQSNKGLGNRIATWPDGTASFVATWDHSGNTSFPERGTGYNYFDGTYFNDEPEERIEFTRSGWPSIAACGDGEILASHASGVNVYYRPQKGEGEWTQLANFPDMSWPRVVTSGPNGQYVHIVACYQEYVNDVYVNHLYYIRSTDRGQTWSDVVDLPLVDNSIGGEYNNQLSADQYSMTSNGDNVVVMLGGYSTEVFYIISHDNGATWEKQVIAPFPYGHALDWNDYSINVETDTIWSCDNSFSCTIGNDGVVHASFALFRFAPSADGDGNYTYWYYTNGIVYWNSEYVNEQGGHEIPLYGNWSGDANHPEWLYNGANGVSSTLNPNRLKALAEANSNQNLYLIIPDENHDGYVNTEYWSSNLYQYRTKGTSTMPAISIDESNNLIIAYSTPSESRINHDYESNYRSCLVTARDSYGNWFQDAFNLSEGPLHENDEVYYVTAAMHGNGCNFWVMYSADEQLGLYMDSNLQYDLTENYIYAVRINPSELDGWASPNYLITATANPMEGGTVSGTGRYAEGELCSLLATANSNYFFTNWTENGEIVSTEINYSFNVTGNRNLVANFIEDDGYYWDVNIHQYPDNMAVTGIIQINGEEQSSTALEIGAFNGDECRGRERLVYSPMVNRTIVFLTIYGVEGDELTFRLYDHQTHEEVDLICSSTITFAVNDMIGSPFDPYVFNFVDASVEQINSLSAGWNWYSTFIELNDIDGIAMLEEQLGENAESINSQTSFTMYYTGYGWWGSLEVINNESMYRLKMINPTSITMTGMKADPLAHPITVTKGWNHIGFISPVALDVNSAFANLNATPGDIVKNQSKYAQYYDGYGWYGSLTTSGVINPGEGLMYKSEANENKTFTYPDNTTRSDVTSMASEDKYWTNDTHAYPSNMTMLAVVELDGVELGSDNYEIAAFAFDGCRGSIRLSYVEPINRYVAFLTVAGNEAKGLRFALFNTLTGETVLEADEQVTYESDAALGTFDEPFMLHFRQTTSVDEANASALVYPNPTDSKVTVEALGMRHVSVTNTLGQVLYDADVNGDMMQLDLNAFNPGMYLIQIHTDYGNIVRKVTVVK